MSVESVDTCPSIIFSTLFEVKLIVCISLPVLEIFNSISIVFDSVFGVCVVVVTE